MFVRRVQEVRDRSGTRRLATCVSRGKLAGRIVAEVEREIRVLVLDVSEFL